VASYEELTSHHDPGMSPAGHPHPTLRNEGNAPRVLAAPLPVLGTWVGPVGGWSFPK
jgi:hypothetical protein